MNLQFGTNQAGACALQLNRNSLSLSSPTQPQPMISLSRVTIIALSSVTDSSRHTIIHLIIVSFSSTPQAPASATPTATFQSSYRPPHNTISDITTTGRSTSASSTRRYRSLTLSSQSAIHVNSNINNNSKWKQKLQQHRFVLFWGGLLPAQPKSSKVGPFGPPWLVRPI